ncbi:Ni/Fe hydrogenase subunit alpha [Candidatus Woesearchaeota archaeon]|nr:Ni/Fe hydrogenase subunit alpha [Candidatus Woesearchaeota archaeon]
MTKTIKLNHITKIEGHANLVLAVDGSQVKKCELMAAEGSRYFEGLLRGRKCYEAPEITSRICGICSCGHTICSIQAIENALGIRPTEQTKMLRELLTLGERIRSHATHLYFLALPDYKGFESALAMAAKHKPDLARAMRLIKIGNQIVTVVGGREMHPVSAQVGGMLKLPEQEQIDDLRRMLQDVQQDAAATAQLFMKLKNPKFDNPTEYFSLHDGQTYPVLYGDLLSQSNKFKKSEYLKYIDEYHEPYATANFVVKKDKQYMVGALARLNNNYRFLSKNAKKAVAEAKLKFPIVNPFMNNLAQAIELVHYIDRAIEICRKLKVHDESAQEVKFKKARGVGVIEVPRGLLFHDYEINEKGEILKANIITPTAQLLLNMQEDIRAYVESLLKQKKMNDKLLVSEVEKLIRSYDPCFSCASHFLKVKFE